MLTPVYVPTSPSSLSFTDVTGQDLSTLISSNTVTLSGPSGVRDSWPVTVDGDGSPNVRINGGTWTDTRVPAAVARNGDTLQVRLTSSGSATTARTATVRVGGRSTVWSVTTGAWSPPAVSGLKLWLTAGPTWCFLDAGGTTPCGNGDPVYVWADRSGNAVNLTQSTAGQRPTLVTSGGLWRVRFDGTDDRIVSSALASWGTTAGTLGVRHAGNATGINIFAVTGTGLASNEYTRYSGDGKVYARTFNTARYSLGAHPNDTSAHTLVIKSGADYRGYLDGSQSGTTQTASWESPSAWVCGYSAGGYSRVDVAGVVAYDSALSDADRGSLETYLGALL